MNVAAVRTSQRTPRSCRECSRRKMRCDKRIPCQPCIRRHMAHECAREVVKVRGRMTIAPDESFDQEADLVRQNSMLRQRILQLETSLNLTRSAPYLSTVSLENHVQQDSSDADSLERERVDEEQDLQLELEGLNIGAILGEEKSSSVGRLISDQSSPTILDVLPSRATSTQIVDFSLEMLGWLHCALRSKIFREEHESFWDRMELGDESVLEEHAWIAVYFSVMAVGLFFMESQESLDETLVLGQVTAGNSSIARKWYETALNELQRADYTSRADIRTVQTIAILTLCNANFGESERGYLLLGIAINAARSLQMHRLGSENSFPQSLASWPEWSTPSSREQGRRLWWTLCICDWFGVINRPASISPATFDCVLSLGPHDDDIILHRRDPDLAGIPVPSPLLFHTLLAKMAYIVYVYVKASSNHSSIKMFKALEEIESVGSTFASHLSLLDDNSLDLFDNRQHPWIPFQRHYLIHSFQFLRLTLGRQSFGQWLHTEDPLSFHKKAKDAASQIIKESMNPVLKIYQKPWIVPASTVAAGIFLGLELLCFRTDKTQDEIGEQLASIRCCITSLQGLDKDVSIARKGCRILERLHSLGNDSNLSLPDTYERLKMIRLLVAAPRRPRDDVTSEDPLAADKQPSHQDPASFSNDQPSYANMGILDNVIPGNDLSPDLFADYFILSPQWADPESSILEERNHDIDYNAYFQL